MSSLLELCLRVYQRNRFFILGCLFELALVPLALVLGYFLQIHPTADLSFSWMAIFYGFIAALPMIALFVLMQRYPVGGLAKIQEFFEKVFCPLLGDLNWLQLAALSLFAGVGEELLFRGLLQSGFAKWDGMNGLLGSNILFGLAHAVTTTYTVLAAAAGVYLGLLWEIAPQHNLLVPITTHAFYDFLALVYLSVIKPSVRP